MGVASWTARVGRDDVGDGQVRRRRELDVDRAGDAGVVVRVNELEDAAGLDDDVIRAGEAVGQMDAGGAVVAVADGELAEVREGAEEGARGACRPGRWPARCESLQVPRSVRPMPRFSTRQLTCRFWPLSGRAGHGHRRHDQVGVGDRHHVEEVRGARATLLASAPFSKTTSVPSALTNT